MLHALYQFEDALEMKIKLPSVTAILAGIIGLIVFYPLVGCGNMSGVSDATTIAGHQSTSWQLVWSDEFDGPKGSAPAANKWKPEVGNGVDGWGNKELEYNTDNQNAYLDGQGNLVLEARKENPNGYQCWYGPCKYT